MSYVVLDAVRQWRFEPGKIGGKAVPVVFTLTVNFNP
jgi:outer membrane biosynthesis protein TonB